MDAVNRRHEGKFQVATAKFDDAGRLTRLIYKSDQLGWKYDAELQLKFTHVPDGRPVVPSGRRVIGGPFELLVNEHAPPERIREAIEPIADNVLDDPAHKVPF